jgi:hypothetical protein
MPIPESKSFILLMSVPAKIKPKTKLCIFRLRGNVIEVQEKQTPISHPSSHSYFAGIPFSEIDGRVNEDDDGKP